MGLLQNQKLGCCRKKQRDTYICAPCLRWPVGFMHTAKICSDGWMDASPSSLLTGSLSLLTAAYQLRQDIEVSLIHFER